MTRLISRAESWEKAYEAFENINFAAFDYDTLKQSMLDYVRLYFPEDFNDYIETSEFIALVELFAYLGELISYRLDMNAHENFITTAQRKESVLRLAKLISYKASRNIPNRGLVKIQSVQTTESVFDATGVNIQGQKINWNDPNDPQWKERFLSILNRVMQQNFGSISPSERIQVDNILFELYMLNNVPVPQGVIPFSASVSGESIPLELVPVDLTQRGPVERRPEENVSFSILYGSDGLGDSSDTTGFFMYAKQGSLRKTTTRFDGSTPNLTRDVEFSNINETDVWVNEIDPETGRIANEQTDTEGRSGEWFNVNLTRAENIAFNTQTQRQKFEVETLDNDNIRIIFGDGEFSDIPGGIFEIWTRTSRNEDLIIPQTSVQRKSTSFNYTDRNGNTQTLTIEFSLINSLQNGSPAETIEHIKDVAPSVYYTQDRMVNGRDYNTYPLQDPSILKLRTINRTYAGDSKYLNWHDPSESYENVKMFGDDLMLYYKEQTALQIVDRPATTNEIISNYLQPLLASTDLFVYLRSQGVPVGEIEKTFTNDELDEISTKLNDAPTSTGGTVYLYFSLSTYAWSTSPFTEQDDQEAEDWLISIVPVNDGPNHVGWEVYNVARRLIAESRSTQFWNTNEQKVISYDSLKSNFDSIVVLSANKNAKRNDMFNNNIDFDILGHETTDDGLPNIHQLSILPADENEDKIPDNLDLTDIINPMFTFTSTGLYDIPFNFNSSMDSDNIIPDDIVVTGDVDNAITWEAYYNGTVISSLSQTKVANQINITSIGNNSEVYVSVNEYVYFHRDTIIDPWQPMEASKQNIDAYNTDVEAHGDNFDQRLWQRYNGRSGLNFGWFHQTPRFHLIDPSYSNITDMFLITQGYHTSLQRWLSGQTTIEPEPPSPRQLRSDYSEILNGKMLSDTVVLHPGKFKLLFGDKAQPELRANFKVVRPQNRSLTDNQVKVQIVDVIKNFFSIDKWEFGETFYYTELSAAIHNSLGSEIDSVVLIPRFSTNQFGDMFEVFVREDEVLQADISVTDIQIVESLNAQTLRQDPTL